MADDLRTLAADALRKLGLGWYGVAADAVLAAVLPAHRAQVLDEAAQAISDNVRNDDWTKQDRGGFYGIAPKMAYVAGHDKAVDIVQRLAVTGPTATPGPRQEPEGGPAVPEATPRPSHGCDDCDETCTEKCACPGCTAPDSTEEETP